MEDSLNLLILADSKSEETINRLKQELQFLGVRNENLIYISKLGNFENSLEFPFKTCLSSHPSMPLTRLIELVKHEDYDYFLIENVGLEEVPLLKELLEKGKVVLCSTSFRTHSELSVFQNMLSPVETE